MRKGKESEEQIDRKSESNEANKEEAINKNIRKVQKRRKKKERERELERERERERGRERERESEVERER